MILRIGAAIALMAAGVKAEEARLHLAPGPVDDLSFDRGWHSTHKEPEPEEEPEDDPESVAGMPEMMAASIETAKAIDRLTSQPPGLYYARRSGRLRVDNAGQGVRYLGTSALRALEGDFVLEFELTAAIVGTSPIRFGLSGQPKQLVDAEHALFIEYRAFDPRKPYLRLMERTPDTLRELGRLKNVGRMADKLIRLERKGQKARLTIQQDYLLEGTLESEIVEAAPLNWLGAYFSKAIPPKSDQRTIAYIDNIRGLDPAKEDRAPRGPLPALELPAIKTLAWPPTILAAGTDVTSEQYAAEAGLAGRLRLERKDLSDAAGWPSIKVEPGVVACDPTSGRVRFSDGLAREIRRIGSQELLRGVPHHAVIKNGHVYLAHGDGGPDSHLIIIDVTAPASPKVASSLGLKWRPQDLEVFNGIAYVPDGFLLHAVEVRDPQNPKLLATYSKDLGLGKGEARCVAASGDLAFVGAENLGLVVLDVSNPASPEYLGTARERMRRPVDIAVKGKLAWVASEDGLHLFDASKPTKPRRVSSRKRARPAGGTDDLDLGLGLDTGGGATGAKAVSLKDLEAVRHPVRLFLTEEYLYVVDRKQGLLVIDIVDPLNPETVGSYRPSEGKTVKGVSPHATSVYVVDQTAYLTVNHGYVPQKGEDAEELMQVDVGGGLHVLNVADPLEPFLMGRYAVPETPTDFVDVVVEGNRAFVSDAVFGLWAIDVSDERQPVRLGGVPTQGEIRDMSIEGDVAYLASGSGQGVFAVDIADPASPKLLGHYHTGFDSPSVAAYEGVVYTGGADWALPNGLHAVNFRDPKNPKRVALLPTRPASQWMNCDGLLYASSGEVFQLEDPFRPTPYGRLPSGVMIRSKGTFYIARPNVIYGLTVIAPRVRHNPLLARTRLSLDSGGRSAVARRGDLLFIAGGTRGVAIVNVRNPMEPRVLKILKSNIGSAVDVAVHGRYLVVTDLYSGIKLYDATIPGQPRLRAIYPPGKPGSDPGGYRSAVHNGRLYRTRLNGLDVLELPSPPEAPNGEVTVAPR